MSSCAHLDARDQARATIARLAGRPDVIGTDLVAPNADPTGRWTVEIAIEGDHFCRQIARRAWRVSTQQ